MIIQPVFVDAAVAQMKDKFWGPVPISDFFEEFLDGKFPCLPSTANSGYEILACDIAALKAESDMYELLVRFIYIMLP